MRPSSRPNEHHVRVDSGYPTKGIDCDKVAVDRHNLKQKIQRVLIRMSAAVWLHTGRQSKDNLEISLANATNSNYSRGFASTSRVW